VRLSRNLYLNKIVFYLSCNPPTANGCISLHLLNYTVNLIVAHHQPTCQVVVAHFYKKKSTLQIMQNANQIIGSFQKPFTFSYQVSILLPIKSRLADITLKKAPINYDLPSQVSQKGCFSNPHLPNPIVSCTFSHPPLYYHTFAPLSTPYTKNP
jgi:hypothetical protein